MWLSERIAIAYFVYLAVVCWLRPVPPRRRAALAGISLAVILAIRQIAALDWPLIRALAPGAYIVAGYYESALVFVKPSPAIESWLMSWDRRLLGDPSTRFAAWPRPVLAVLELLYIGCFLFVGSGILVLWWNGHQALADRYWTLVIGAEFGSFGPLAFIQTRPPWALERKPVLADPRVHELATQMTELVTIRVNTFPSGHVAASLAAAIAIAAAMPWTGALFFVLAICISVATVVGRYHYVVDAIAGAALTFTLWAVLAALVPH